MPDDTKTICEMEIQEQGIWRISFKYGGRMTHPSSTRLHKYKKHYFYQWTTETHDEAVRLGLLLLVATLKTKFHADK